MICVLLPAIVLYLSRNKTIGVEVGCFQRWRAGRPQAYLTPNLRRAPLGMSGLQVRGSGGSIEHPKSWGGGGLGKGLN